jgi:hypothetical protein
MAYTSDEITIFYTLVGFFSGLSMLGCLFIIVAYFYNPELRVFSFKLIVCLSIAGFGNSLCNLHLAYVLPKVLNQTVCTVQAYLVVYFSLCALIWTFCIALTLYNAVVMHQEDHNALEFYFHVTAWLVPAAVAALPLITDSYDRYDDNNLWCWISKEKRVINHVWRGLAFYIPLWLCILANFYIYYKIRKCLNQEESFITTNSEVVHQLIFRLRLYPLILLASEIGTSFYRLMQLVDEKYSDNFELPLIAVTISTLVGLLNSIVYGMNPTVKKCVSKYISGLRVTSNTISENDLSDDSYNSLKVFSTKVSSSR